MLRMTVIYVGLQVGGGCLREEKCKKTFPYLIIRCRNKKRGAVMAPLFAVIDLGYLLITIVLL